MQSRKEREEKREGVSRRKDGIRRSDRQEYEEDWIPEGVELTEKKEK